MLDRTINEFEINAALLVMGLALPVTPEAITHQYRVLAMRSHPDRNPHDPDATRRFQEINGAMDARATPS